MELIERKLSFLERAKKLTKEKLAKGFLIEEELTDQKEIDFRLEKCRSCIWYDKRKDECKDCGCIVSLKSTTKVSRNPNRGGFKEIIKGGELEQTHCPQGRWNDKDIANFYRSIEGRVLLD